MAAKAMAAQISSQAHAEVKAEMQAAVKVKTEVETEAQVEAEIESEMPLIEDRPQHRVRDLHLAQARVSIQDQFEEIVAERRQHYAEIAAKHPRTPMPTTVEEAERIIFDHVQTDATKRCVDCFKQAKANNQPLAQACHTICPV